MKVLFGSDHAGVELKEEMMALVGGMGHECVDFGNYDKNDRGDDYPVYGRKVAEAIAAGEGEMGVLICGTGLGMALTANKVKGIRACVCSEPYTAKMARAHNNCQILCLGARVIGRELAAMITETFFTTEFEGGRHARRVAMIAAAEAGEEFAEAE